MSFSIKNVSFFFLVKIEKCVLRKSKYMKRKKEIPVSENLSLTSSAALL